MNLSDATQMEETKFARHEEQVMSGQSENRLKNLDFSSNRGSLRKSYVLLESLWVLYEGITCQ
jgi:hypothetical protein